MFKSGLRIVASKYDDKLLSSEDLLWIVSSHVGVLPGGRRCAGDTGSCKKKQQQHKNPALGKYDVNERANVRLLCRSVVHSINLLWGTAVKMECTVVFVWRVKTKVYLQLSPQKHGRRRSSKPGLESVSFTFVCFPRSSQRMRRSLRAIIDFPEKSSGHQMFLMQTSSNRLPLMSNVHS